MAALSDIRLSIDRTSYPGGSICTVNYAYVLICDETEVHHKIAFTLWCELWGKDLIIDDALGDPAYDSHTVPAAPRLATSRSFTVPCAVLDEDLGTDEVYIKVTATSTLGATFSAVSDVVSDHF